MTKNFLYFIALSFILVACSNDDNTPIDNNSVKEYVTIPDENFEKQLIALKIDSDNSLNHQILKSDAEKISRLDLSKNANLGEIKDLTGIDAFVNLTYLSASQHKIESIDIHTNNLLDTLLLEVNLLQTLDVSNNKKLILIDIQSNELKTIKGLSNITALKKLNASWNYIENFELNNPSIEILHMSHNDIKNIHLDGCSKLKNILLTSNKINTLSLTTNTALETVLISDNQLKTLPLKNNTKLTHLYGSSNLFESFDVSNNRELVDLRIDRNPNLTCIKIANNQNIPTVSMSNYQSLNTSCD